MIESDFSGQRQNASQNILAIKTKNIKTGADYPINKGSGQGVGEKMRALRDASHGANCPE